MNDYDDAGMVEPFGPEYVRPTSPVCANCTCCTGELCVLGRANTRQCAGHVRDEDRARVTGCPCSSEAAHGSLAWRAVRVRAVTAATEKPLPSPLETLLLAVADGETLNFPGDGLRVLAARRYLDLPEGSGPRLTEFGRLYLAARREARQTTPLIVQDVDVRTRTARVVVVGRRTDRTVTVPMDQLANRHTALTPAQLPGAVLHAHANCAAVLDDDVVLTQVRNPRLPVFPFRPSRFSMGARVAREALASGGDL